MNENIDVVAKAMERPGEVVFEWSPEIKDFASDFNKAQREIKKAKKDSSNPHFGSKYADLESVSDACLPQLNANNISVMQVPFTIITGAILWAGVKTLFIHTTGQFCSGTLLMPVQGKGDSQAVVSAHTYGRRDALGAMSGVAPSDDDGNAAAGKEAEEAPRGATALAKQALEKVGWKPASPPPTEDSESFKGQIPPEDNADLFGPSEPQAKGGDFVIDYPPELAGKKASDLSKQELKRIAAMKRKAIANGKYVEQNTSQLRFIESLLSVPF